MELDAKRRLVLTNAIPRLELNNLEAQYKAAEAALAAAEAERDRGHHGAVGRRHHRNLRGRHFGLRLCRQGDRADRWARSDARVVEVSERKVANVKVGDMAEVKLVSGQTREGRIRYVSKSAVPATRTYRVEVQCPTPDGAIPGWHHRGGVTIPMSPLPATRVPRSALVVSSAVTLASAPSIPKPESALSQ